MKIFAMVLLSLLVAGSGRAAAPAILVIDEVFGGFPYWSPLTFQEMLDHGYQVAMCPHGKAPTLDELKRYNVALVVSTGKSFATDLQPKLEAFMAAGGGVLVTPSRVEVGEFQWLRSIGARVRLAGIVDEPRRKGADWCKQPGIPMYIWTTQIADSPITRGVKTLWYRTGQSMTATGMTLSGPLELSADWQPLVFTGPDSRGVSWLDSRYESESLMTKEFRAEFKDFIPPSGEIPGRQPLVAVRSRGAGRLAVVSLNPQDILWSPYIPARGGVVLHRGFDGRTSDGWQLLDNLYRWLAEPSLAGGQLGGATTDPTNMFRKPLRGPQPFPWKTGAEAGLGKPLDAADKLLVDAVPEAGRMQVVGEVPIGLAGARSACTSGQGTVADWAAAARAAGLDFLVFMEDWSAMTKEKWDRFRQECAAASDDRFLAYPGLGFEHENFNRGYMFSRQWEWLGVDRILTRDGRFVQTSRNLPNSECGPLTLWLAYNQPVRMGTQFTLGFYAHQTNLTPTWAQRGFGSMAVMTRDRNGWIDTFADALPIFRRCQNQKLVISPMALSLMDSPAEIAGVVDRGGPFVSVLGSREQVGRAFDTGGTYCYAGRASSLCATTGPRIVNWGSSPTAGYTFDRWNVARREEDFFQLDNYRCRFRLTVESAVGLAEIVIYDGDQSVYRRFLPNGAKVFDVTMDLCNDQSRHLVPVVTDVAGGIAVAPEIQTENWANRHYLCSDRCNFGCNNEGQGAYFPNPGPYTTQYGPETMYMVRWSRPVISADGLSLTANLERRFEIAGACGYGYGNPWHCYYRTWPMEQMRIADTQHRWRGQFGGTIYYTEEYWPAELDSIWDFPMPDQPFYPENRWPPDPWTAGLPDWKLAGDNALEVEFKQHAVLQEPFIPALRVQQNYTPGAGSYDFRIGDQRLAGLLPGKDDPPLDRTGPLPGPVNLFALTGEPEKTGWTWFLTGQAMQYRLHAANGKVSLDAGWPVADSKVAAGTDWAWRLVSLEGPPTTAALDELGHPTGIAFTAGRLTPGCFPLSLQADAGAVAFTADDLRGLPVEWIPLEIHGLSTHGTAYWRELDSDRIRPIGVDPDGIGRVVLWRGKHGVRFFCGQPICCSDPDILYDAVRLSDGTWFLDVNNPTDTARTVDFTWHSAWPGTGDLPAKVPLPPGGRFHAQLQEVAR